MDTPITIRTQNDPCNCDQANEYAAKLLDVKNSGRLTATMAQSIESLLDSWGHYNCKGDCSGEVPHACV